MKAYLDNLKQIKEKGFITPSRPGVETVTSFAMLFKHDLREGFPLLTTKKVNLRKALAEMFGFFRGATTIDEFHALDCDLWDSWALDEDYYEVIRKPRSELLNELKTIDNESIDVLSKKLYTMDDAHKEWIDLALENSASVTGSDMERYQQGIEFGRTNPEPMTADKYLISKGIELARRNYIAKKGDLGPIYGKQWTQWESPNGCINQIANVIKTLKENPFDRRMVISGWNPADINHEKMTMDAKFREVVTSHDAVMANIMIDKMALPPCHLMNMFLVEPGVEGEPDILHMSLIMRSSDYPVGFPFNTSGYAAMQSIIAEQVGMVAGEIAIFSNNAHIYTDQLVGVEEQLSREPRKLPTLTIPKGIDLLDHSTLTIETIDKIMSGLEDYNPHPFIKFPVAI